MNVLSSYVNLSYQQIQDLGDTPKKDKEKGKQKGKGKSKASPLESGDEYSIGDLPTDGATSDSGGSVVSEGAALELSQLIVKQHKKKKSRHLDDAAATHLVSNHAEPPDESLRTCGLCGLSHPNTKCYMTESSENLAGYRNILLTHAGDEPLEDRVSSQHVNHEFLTDVKPSVPQYLSSTRHYSNAANYIWCMVSLCIL